MAVTLKELVGFLAEHQIPCEIEGDASAEVSSVATLEDAQPDQISFLSNPKYEKEVERTKALAVFVKPGFETERSLILLRTPEPYAAVTAAIVRLHGYRQHPQWGVSDRAEIAPSATVGENASIAPNVTIADNVRIGRNAVLYPGVYVASGSELGDDVTLFSNVVIYEGCKIGDRVTIHAGSVIGEDGLGYAPVGEKWVKIPQIGSVVIGNDVEIGACCTIDRATLGNTVIGSGTKFSDLIAIGHGSKIGEDCLFVAQVGIAGSVTVGRHVTLAGQVGVAGHLTIGDNATVGAKSGVKNDIQPGQTVLGQPAVPIKECRRQLAVVQRLPDMKNEIKKLREEVAQLKNQLDSQCGNQNND